MILGIISLFIIYSREFFDRSNPKMSFEEIKYWNPPKEDISTDFVFTIIMKYKGITSIRDDVIKIEAVYITKNGTQGEEKRSIESIPCERRVNDKDHLYETLELSKGSCFNFTGITLLGTRVNDEYRYIQITFMLCINKTDCMPLNQMDKFFEDNKPLALFYFQDSLFLTHDKVKRIMTSYNYVEVNVTYRNSKQTDIYFSKKELLVDDSYVVPSSKVYSSFMIDSFRDLVSVSTENQPEALKFNVLLSKNKRVILCHICNWQSSLQA